MKRLIALSTLLAFAAGASAQVPGPGGPPGGPGMMRAAMGMRGPAGFALLQYDTNSDGKLTRAEFDAAQRRQFGEIDANKDGSATPDEIRANAEVQAKAARETALKFRFTELDKDKNSQLSQAEFLAGIDDRGGDAGRSLRGLGGPYGGGMRFDGPRRPRGDRDGPRGRGGPNAQAGPPQQNARDAAPTDRPMRAGPADQDGDGKLTFAEFTGRTSEAFTRADTNKDGTVTIAELQTQFGGNR